MKTYEKDKRTKVELDLYRALSEAERRSDWKAVKYYNRLLTEAEINIGRQEFLHKPRVLQAELTGRCNARCVMCSHYYEHNDLGKHMSPEGLSLLREGLPYAELVLLNGYGEPLISPVFKEVLELLAQYDVKAMMTTNLSVVKEEYLRLFPRIFDMIHISCNGTDKASYEEIHRGASFSTFMKNLDAVTSVMDSHKLSLSCVAMVRTVPNVQKMVRFAAEHGIPSVRFGRLGINAFIRNTDQDPSAYPQGTAYAFSMAEKEALRVGVCLTYPENYRIPLDKKKAETELQEMKNIKFRYEDETEGKLRREFHSCLRKGGYLNHVERQDRTPVACEGICDWTAEGLYIHSDGTMYPCCESRAVSYEGGYNGAPAKRLRGEFYGGRLPDFCKNCPFIANGELKRLKCAAVKELYRSSYYAEGD